LIIIIIIITELMLQYYTLYSLIAICISKGE